MTFYCSSMSTNWSRTWRARLSKCSLAIWRQACLLSSLATMGSSQRDIELNVEPFCAKYNCHYCWDIHAREVIAGDHLGSANCLSIHFRQVSWLGVFITGNSCPEAIVTCPLAVPSALNWNANRHAAGQLATLSRVAHTCTFARFRQFSQLLLPSSRLSHKSWLSSLARTHCVAIRTRSCTLPVSSLPLLLLRQYCKLKNIIPFDDGVCPQVLLIFMARRE